MDYNDVQQIMERMGVADEPAFKDVKVTIQAMPYIDGCPLGLYHTSGLIALPPNFQPAALYHELGHRYGHYYYNNLSESYAEQWRKHYQREDNTLMYVGRDTRPISKFGKIFNEGERGAVEIAMFRPVNDVDLNHLVRDIKAYSHVGEPLPQISTLHQNGLHLMRMDFTKGVDWMLITGATLAGIVAAGIGVIGYAIYKISSDIPIAVPIIGAALLALWLLRGLSRQQQFRSRIGVS